MPFSPQKTFIFRADRKAAFPVAGCLPAFCLLRPFLDVFAKLRFIFTFVCPLLEGFRFSLLGRPVVIVSIRPSDMYLYTVFVHNEFSAL